MDKNTIIGFVLIGLLLVGFNFFTRPSEEQVAAMKQYNDSITAVQAEQEAQTEKHTAALSHVAPIKVDSTSLFYNASEGTEQFTTLENDVMKVTFSNKGGRVYSAELKEYKNQGDEKGENKTNLVLFKDQENSFNFNFYNQNEVIQSKDFFFTPVNVSETGLTMRLMADSNSYIDFIYSLDSENKEDYLVDFQIKATGMEGKLAHNDYIDIDWAQRTPQHEQGFVFENRLSRLTYRTFDKDTERLTETKAVTETPEKNLNWIAFRSQFFSTVFITDQGFKDSKLTSTPEEKGSGYIKDYKAEMKTFFDPSGKEATQMYLYLGPNHYKTLKAIDSDKDHKWKLNSLVYLGWPVVKQINQWFTINIFDWLTHLGMSMGVVLLIMTIIVKAIVYPATKKTYMSSAKMRVLKPQVDAINAKYPNQEDAMKKQQEVMSLYSQYGVSPMGGCLPMLLQFPILMALFMFVPSAIELRQESFLWATDLSTYDALIKFPFHIPLLGDHLSIFCLLMTVTNILNTKYTMAQQNTGAQPQMPAMKWMMYLMPIMFLFILNDYPSGLCYYYFLSTLISVMTMIFLRKTTDEEKLLAKLEANKNTEKKKSGFAARLQAMQEQQEALKTEARKRNKK